MNEVVEQLASMVGGSNNASTTRRTNRSSSKSMDHSDHAFHQIAGGKSNKTATNVAKATAAKAIPLGDDDGGFDDFND